MGSSHWCSIAAVVTGGAVLATNHHTSKLSSKELKAAEQRWRTESASAANVRVAERLQEGVSRILLAAVEYHTAIVAGRLSVESEAIEFHAAQQSAVGLDPPIAAQQARVAEARAKADEYFRAKRAHLSTLDGEVTRLTRLDDLIGRRSSIRSRLEELSGHIDTQVRSAVSASRTTWTSAVQLAELIARQASAEIGRLGEHLEHAEIAATRPDGADEMQSQLALSMLARQQLVERTAELVNELTTPR